MTGNLDSTIFTVLCIGIPLIVAAALVVQQYWMARILPDRWRELAERSGLAYQPGGPFKYESVTGEQNGRQLTLDVYLRSNGRYSTEYTRVRLGLKKTLAGMVHVHRQGPVGELTQKLFSPQDYPIGSEQFSDTFMIKGSSFGFAEDVLDDSSLQETLLELNTIGWFELEMRESEMTYLTRDIIENVERLQNTFRLLGEIAGKVEGSKKPGIFQ